MRTRLARATVDPVSSRCRRRRARLEPAAPRCRMLFRVLGPLEVEADTGPVALTGARSRALLTALLLQPGAVVPAHRLIAALWGERLPEDASNALHQVVGRLRRQLGDDVVATGP